LNDIEEAVSQPLEQRLQELREQGQGYVGDAEEEVSWWPCFAEKSAAAASSVKASDSPPRERAVRTSPPSPVQPLETFIRQSPKLGRNDPCHCGSGKKFKKCHSAV
jgi:uncharacterized protein YecA (UPF0149 family)